MKKITLLVLLFNLTYAQKDNRKLIWEENFNGKALDTTVWNFELGNGCPNICI